MDLQGAGGTKLLQRVVQEDLECQVLRWLSGKINGCVSNSYLPICQFLLLVRLSTSWAFALIQYGNISGLCGVLFLPVWRDMNYQNNLSLSVVHCGWLFLLLCFGFLINYTRKKPKNQNKCLEDVWKLGNSAS